MPTRRELDPEIITVFFPEDGRDFGGISKPTNLSRWVIGDLEFDDLQNFIPMGKQLQQVPANGSTIFTLPSLPTWLYASPLNLATNIYSLGANGALYQTSLGGVNTVVAAAATVSQNTDIANWQGTTILYTDLNAAKIYSWNGTTFATVFTAQPAQWITVYAGRLWMANQSTITFTQSGTFNSLSGDAGSFIVTDSDCPPPIRALYPYGGNLYVFGYNWVKVYGGLFDTGSPPVLQFQQSTLTDEAGIINKWGVLPFGYSVYYASLYGIWNLLGSQPLFLSDDVDQFFQGATLPNSSFSAAYGQVLGKPCLMWNLFYSPDSTYRILCWQYDANPQKRIWFTVNQSNLAFITYGVDQTNGQQKVFASDTSGNLIQLFSNSAGSVTSKYSTKLWSFGSRIREKSIIRCGIETVVTGPATVTVTGRDKNLNSYTPPLQSANPTTGFTWNNGAFGVFTWTNGASGTFSWQTNGTQYELMDFEMPITTKKFGMDVTLTGSGCAVNSSAVEYEELPADWGQ